MLPQFRGLGAANFQVIGLPGYTLLGEAPAILIVDYWIRTLLSMRPSMFQDKTPVYVCFHI